MAKDCTYFDKDTSVRGELSTSDLIIEGSFEGKIYAKGSVLLTKSVQLNADIFTKKLKVEKGASYNGSITLINGEE